MKRSTIAWAAVAACALVILVVASGHFDPIALTMASGDNYGLYFAEVAGAAALEKQLEAVTKEIKTAADEVKTSGEKMQKEMKTLGDANAETKKQVDEALTKHNKLMESHAELTKKFDETVSRIVEIEQEMVKRKERNDDEPQLKTMGEMFVESEAFKSFKGKGAVRVAMNRKDILSTGTSVGSNTSIANSLAGTLRVPGVVTPPERKLTIRDLLAPGTTNQSAIEYVQETGFTNAAAVVTEGSSKPQSELTFELKHAPVRTIAHIFKASRQILDDSAALQSYIDARARYGLRLEEEDELLNGDGTGAHVSGLVTNATAFDAAFVVEAKSNIDTIRLAILQVFLAEFPANGIVLHPTDWARVQLIKDSQERYIIGNPQDGNTPKLWNLPVVETQSMDVTEFLVGAFNMGAQIFDRLEIEVLLSTEDGDNFVKNMITLRCEERLALAVYRPAAFVSGDFDTAT